MTVAAPPVRDPRWRREVPVVKDGQVTTGGMWDHQRRWWDLPNFVRLLVTGYGGGKTSVLCKRMIALALHNAPAPCAIVSPTFPVARETVISTLEEQLRGKASLIPGFRWTHNKTEHVFRIRYQKRRGRIIVYSGEHPDRLKGPNLAAVGIDEPFIQDQEVFKQMIARIRDPRARRQELNCTGTPESLNWGFELAEGKLRKNYDVGLVQASTADNLLMAGDYFDRLMAQYGSKEREAFVRGQFVNLASGQVYYGFDPKRNVKDFTVPRNATGKIAHGELGVGMDFGAARNYASMASAVFWTDGHRMHVFEEHEQTHSDTPFMCETLREEHGMQLLDVYPDASGQARQSASGLTDFQTLGAFGFAVNSYGTNPGRRDRYNRVNACLESGCLTISPALDRLRLYLAAHTHEEMKKQKQMTHLLDALGYAVCYLFPAEDPHLHTVGLM